MIAISDVRPRAAAALAPQTDDEPTVIGLTDAVVAPCLQLSWAQPWLVANGQAPAFYARLSVLAVSGRVDAEGSLELLEDLVVHVVRGFAVDALPWVPLDIGAPRGMEIGGVAYLSSRLVYQTPVDGSKERPVINPLEVAS